MEILITKLEDYQKESEEINEELQALPDGRLVRRGIYLSQMIDEKSIGISKNKELIRKLCRKKFISARKKKLKNNISVISPCVSKLDDLTPSEVIRSLPPTYHGMPISYFFHPSVEVFLAEPYEENVSFPEGKTFSTKNGVIVRSLSEVLIGNQLEEYEIPYRYEAVITLGREKKYPDFTIMNPFTGKVTLWEHFGGLHLDGYGKKMNDKMALYIKHGYISFETIIYTFDADVKNTPRLQYLIENVILRQERKD